MTAVALTLRFLGRVLLSLSYAIDDAWRDLTDATPDVVPLWMDEEADL